MTPETPDERTAEQPLTGRARSLANLKRGNNPAPLGNRFAVKHNVWAKVTDADLERKITEVMAAVADDAPVRASDGGLPRHDSLAVRILAETLIRRERVLAEETANGLEISAGPRKGELRGIVQYGLRLDQQALDLMEALGMTPRSRTKLGLDLVRAKRSTLDSFINGTESK